MASAEVAVDPGILADNGMQIRMLQQALGQSEGLQRSVPDLIANVIDDACWRHFLTVDGHEFRWKPAEFRRFLEAPRPSGCQTSLSLLDRILRETEAWGPFQDLIRGKPGGDNNPAGKNQHSEVNYDNVIVDLHPPTIPFDPSSIASLKSPPPTGNSVSYQLRRLQKAAPELHERVLRREITPHAAAVQAGFLPKTFTLPFDVPRAARLIKKWFGTDGARALIVELTQALDND